MDRKGKQDKIYKRKLLETESHNEANNHSFFFPFFFFFYV